MDLLKQQRERFGKAGPEDPTLDEQYVRGCNAHLVDDPQPSRFCSYMDLNSLYAFCT
jgi:hypothetical protein